MKHSPKGYPMTTTLPSRTRREVEPMLTPRDIARITHMSEKTVSNWRYTRQGPPFIKRGHCILYPLSAFKAWLAEGTVQTGA